MTTKTATEGLQTLDFSGCDSTLTRKLRALIAANGGAKSAKVAVKKVESSTVDAVIVKTPADIEIFTGTDAIHKATRYVESYSNRAAARAKVGMFVTVIEWEGCESCKCEKCSAK